MDAFSNVFSDLYVTVPIVLAVLCGVVLWGLIELPLLAMRRWRNRTRVDHLSDLRTADELPEALAGPASGERAAPEDASFGKVERKAYTQLDHLHSVQIREPRPREDLTGPLDVSAQADRLLHRLECHEANSDRARALHEAASVELDAVSYQLERVLEEVAPLLGDDVVGRKGRASERQQDAPDDDRVVASAVA